MPILMSTDEMTQLAQKIAKMRFNQAKGYIRSLDKQTRIELFRTAVAIGEWQTRYALPNKNLLITLVEQKEDYGAPSDSGNRQTRFKYLEARVEPLPLNHRNDNEGNDARTASLNMETNNQR
ncbi:MAG: hypothetical protein ABI947_04825 [Chloroflexota bacterium]